MKRSEGEALIEMYAPTGNNERSLHAIMNGSEVSDAEMLHEGKRRTVKNIGR